MEIAVFYTKSPGFRKILVIKLGVKNRAEKNGGSAVFLE